MANGKNMIALLSETKSMASGSGIDGQTLDDTTTDTPGSLVRQRQHRQLIAPHLCGNDAIRWTLVVEMDGQYNNRC